MKFKIIIEKPAQKFILKQPKNQQERLLNAIYLLPEMGDIKAMQGHKNLYRLRIGSYRIIYTVDNGILTVYVLEIGNRGDIYKQY